MAINPHDDYEALAKLLYPSIEASGNVYYGQTRKLAIDELFDKNESGFESYFCSLKNEDNSSQYEQHFHWKLGPFSDTVKIVDDTDDKTYKDYPLAWLKYSLKKKETEHTNRLSAGEYKTHEVEYSLGQPTLYCSLDGLLPNGNIYDGRSFFLDCDGDNKVLYILLYKAPVYEDMDKPLYIEALTDDITVRLVPIDDSIDPAQCKYKYGFDYTNLNKDLTLDEGIPVEKGRRIYFRCENRPQFSSTAYLRFEIESNSDSDEVAVGGNIDSMTKLNENGNMLAYAYCGLLSNNSLITDASKLYIGKISNSGCRYLFNSCSRLKIAPAILPCFELKPSCFQSMFANCSALENMPILPARDGELGCYRSMFECDGTDVVLKLNKVVCLLNPWKRNYTAFWLNKRADVTVHVLTDSGWDPKDKDVLPEGCILDVLDSVTSEPTNKVLVSNKYTEKYLVTHGTNNSNNGRGDITNKSTLGNMEKSFDENNSHPMNTYNVDGSFNQEIWGYKSFCSPVQFRNGIYTDNLAVLSTYERSTSDYINLDLNGSIIKSAESEINLINYKLSNGFDADGNMFTVPLTGYDTQEKHVECSAELVTVGNYKDDRGEYTCESYVSTATDGGRAWSRISANRDDCSTDVTTLVNRNGAKLSLSAIDLDGESRLDILPSKSRFGGNPVTAEKWGLSDIIANTLRGIGYMDNGSACTEYGAVGTLGLFMVNTYFPKAGNIISGDYLSPITIQLNNNALEISVDTDEIMLGTWASLTPVKENSETNNIILAVRVQ